MKVSHYLITIGVIAVLSAGIAILAKSCNEKTKAIVLHPTRDEVDSLNALEEREKAFIDSLQAVIVVSKKHNDSLVKITAKQSDLLQVKTLKVNALVKELELYKKYGDTEAYILGCDSLLPQVSDLTSSLEIYRYDNARLLDSVQRTEDRFSLAIAKKDFLYSELRASYDKISGNGFNLETVNKKLGKQANRKWAVTAQVGYIFDGKQFRYGAGVGVGYILAKF